MSRLTAIISAIVICLVVCLGWLAMHYHNAAAEQKTRSDSAEQQVNAAQAVNVIQGVNDYTMEMSIVEVQGGYLLSGAVKGIPQARLRVSAKFIGELV
ncbi:hypothetical protein SL69_03726 [Klebsiella pneumoniae]|uniref:hypothetical protein n=1 Tax=Klebsiella pneumoniae TaxID=573 RepID=UPI000651642F|nr:hypothetical protein [Klebsiella pneumoniae]KMD03834.1 hypothetical protein SL69_03726 [Klebsiella pneumoniae]